ncbi:anoctamin-5-like isoform X1 [Acropora muricata]|uniref:anoctamin-5-like isoform X1 n=1 Tax=Acropora muricata TaxID=159855 RepID=UPI0034E4800A
MASYGSPPDPYLSFKTSDQPAGFETMDRTDYPPYPPNPLYPPYPSFPPCPPYPASPTSPLSPSYDNEPAYLPHVPQDIYCLDLDESESHPRATKSDCHNGDKYGGQPLLCGFEAVVSSEVTNKLWSPRHRGIQKQNNSNTLFFRDGKRRIDYILAYEIDTGKDEDWQQKREEKRSEFEANLVKAHLELEAEGIELSSNGKTAYIKVHAPWKVLAEGAEEMLMKMPIKENDMDTRDWAERCFGGIGIRSPFELRADELPEQPNYFTCAFRRDKLENFLIPENRDDFFTYAQRSRIVHRILMKTNYGERKNQIGIGRLIGNGSYTAAYPLHEGTYQLDESSEAQRPENARQLLYNTWVNFRRWYKVQPLDHIRDYFGEKIGIYFAWLGFYTAMLVPAALMGLICVIYGAVKVGSYIPVRDICDEGKEKDYPMCPRCDQRCPYWLLSDTCIYSKVAYVFDNEFTVVFAIFMSLWATMFLEFWKRRQAEIAYEWDLLGYEDEEEQPRPEYEAAASNTRLNPITKVDEPYIAVGKKIPRFVCSFSFVLFMLVLVLVAVVAVVVYRAALFAVLAAQGDYNVGAVNIATSATAALINLIIIMILNKFYERLAEILTRWEMPRTQTELEDIFTFKMYLFQFLNFYSSLFYIAFFKQNPGRPGDFNRIFGKYRQEECNPAGCLFELLLQLSVIMVGKQIFNNFIEVIVPKLQNWWKRRQNIETPDLTEYTRWELDYDLTTYPVHGLFYEYLEMVIQFGFVTLFISAFPLGPFFALINNLLEIRLDAYKFVVVFQRPMAARAQDIGIWYTILKSVTKISVVVNGFVIAFVSEFVPRLYYTLGLENDSLEGFVNSTLSCFVVNEFPANERPSGTGKDVLWEHFNNNSCGFGQPTCRFRGYYERPFITIDGQTLDNPRKYEFSTAYWHILASKLFFVLAFLHIVYGLTAIIAWIIPDVPKEVSNQVKRENFLAREALRSADQPDANAP